MPVFNWYAASSLVGYLSTGLSIGLMFPSLIVSWREGFILISGWTNAIWTTAEVFSLAGLLLVPDSLAPQYILIIWYLVADLLFVGEAIVIKGWTCCFRKRPERFARDRLKAFWVKMTSRGAKEAQRQGQELSNEQKAALLATEGHMTKKTIEYKGARWRRDFIVQLAFILTGLFSIIPIWYIAFFRTGIASQPYKWEDNIVSQFDHNAYAGWIMGWLSSAIWVIGRLVDERRIKAAFAWSWNQFAPKRRHLEMPPHVPQEWGGLLNVFVVFVVFCFDNVCQLLCIFLILPEAESGEARRQYCLFQLPWILGSVSALASDMWKIKHLVEDWNEGQNKQIRQAGRWTYAIFPTEPKNKVLERTIDEIWFHPGERAKWLQMRKEYVSRHLADRNKERKERVEVDARDSADVESRMKSDLADAQQAQEEEHDSDHVQTSWADAHQKYLALQQAKKSSHRRKIERTKQVAHRAGYRAIGIEPFTANDDERRRQRKEEVLQARETARLDFRKSKRSHEETKDRTLNERLLQRQRRHDDFYGGGRAGSNGDSVPSQELSSRTARDSRSTPPEHSRSKRPNRSKKRRQTRSDEELLLL